MTVAVRTFDIRNPATGEVLASLPDEGAEEARAAIDAAARAQPDWSRLPAGERSQILRDAARLMLERREALARLVTLEEGKPLAESRGEVAYAASFLDWFADEARRVGGATVPGSSADKRILVLKAPVGVAAAITPWNFPLAMIARKLGAALAAGCTMVVKPSELTPLSAIELASVLARSGLPDGVLSVVAGSDAAAIGDVLLDDFRVRKISFTGSTAVGQHLMERSAKTLKRLSLELGGHAPFIVFADADLELAVEQALASKMRNMGQTCVCANRFIVHERVIGEFSERIAASLAAMRIGNGLDDGVTIGPLIDERAVRKVERQVADATDRGATVVLEGGRVPDLAPGHFVAPTVLAGVDDRMLVSREETFGPVVPLMSFTSEREVVERANGTPYGLAAYFFTRDVGRVLRLAERLEFGVVGANDGLPSTAQAPFGGMKASGFGREGGSEGVAEYLDTKFVSVGGVLAGDDGA